ncbi:hypothetical protein [Bacillus sp. FSL K6-3431]|uniref:hypothetical protein n=1 Tax=Bacillus sp. FSL K6-3431 TaxID=2921500 RepID=UPI0030F9D114
MNNKNFGQNGQNLQPEGQAAKLAVIAGTITTLGDALATIAAILAIEESQQKKWIKVKIKICRNRLTI